ncbi:dTDP-4-dehydrorhamnose reductase [Terrarubrum flagellatum]|uniref:dTDP-4-dehydrorhamnose reductase n=1 Tax=Terrirubrum flagellatum TaxID=2895980 RepID=UPI00314547D0
MKLLVTGRNGQIAQSLAALDSDDVKIIALGRPDLDITDRASIDRAIAVYRPDLVVNAAAYTAVDKAESDQDAAFAVNRDGAGHVAAATAAAGLPIIHISTDYVFAGDKSEPYVETDATGPQNIYGLSKLEGEKAIAAANPAHVILRTAWVYSPYGSNFLKTMLRLAAERDVIRVVADQHGTPTYAPDIAEAIVAVAERIKADPKGVAWRGVFHMVAEGETTWAGFAEEIFRRSESQGGPSIRIESISATEYPSIARRPINSRLSTRYFRRTFQTSLRNWRLAVSDCIKGLFATQTQKSQAKRNTP